MKEAALGGLTLKARGPADNLVLVLRRDLERLLLLLGPLRRPKETEQVHLAILQR